MLPTPQAVKEMSESISRLARHGGVRKKVQPAAVLTERTGVVVIWPV